MQNVQWQGFSQGLPKKATREIRNTADGIFEPWENFHLRSVFLGGGLNVWTPIRRYHTGYPSQHDMVEDFESPNVWTAQILRSPTGSSNEHDMVEVAPNNAAAVIWASRPTQRVPRKYILLPHRQRNSDRITRETVPITSGSCNRTDVEGGSRLHKIRMIVVFPWTEDVNKVLENKGDWDGAVRGQRGFLSF